MSWNFLFPKLLVSWLPAQTDRTLTAVGESLARWARLELATGGLENRCSIQLSYHRVNMSARVNCVTKSDKGKPRLTRLLANLRSAPFPVSRGGSSVG